MLKCTANVRTWVPRSLWGAGQLGCILPENRRMLIDEAGSSAPLVLLLSSFFMQCANRPLPFIGGVAQGDKAEITAAGFHQETPAFCLF